MSQKKVFLLIPLLAIFIILSPLMSGCGAKSADYEGMNKSTDEILPETEKMEETTEPSLTPGDQKAGGSANDDLDASNATQQYQKDQGTQTPPADKEKTPTKIIKTADISMRIEKYDDSRKKILAIAKKYDAYIGSENQSSDGYAVTNIMTIRVKNEKFDLLVEELVADAIFIDYKRINAQDVTEEYVDVQARLKAKKEAEAQYLEIMKKAYTVNEILNVQSYLRSIREEIESFEGRLRYLDNKVDLSTINLTFYERSDVVKTEPGRSFGSRMIEALYSGWLAIVDVFIGLIYIWPLILFTAVSIWIMFVIFKRTKKRRMQKKQQPPVA